MNNQLNDVRIIYYSLDIYKKFIIIDKINIKKLKFIKVIF